MADEKTMLSRARELRKNMTPQENMLWYQFLRHYPVKCYKQKVFERYIADFYCDKAKLVIEIDGSQHYEPEEMEYDRIRTRYFERNGIMVLRFSNRDINTEFQNVCENIHNTISDRIGYEPTWKIK